MQRTELELLAISDLVEVVLTLQRLIDIQNDMIETLEQRNTLLSESFDAIWEVVQ